MAQNIKLFEGNNIRSLWDEAGEKWYFSVHDIIAALTEQSDYTKVRGYWKWLKNKLKQEGSELVSITNQLKMRAPDGKMRETDVMGTEHILRLIQSVPSRKAEPFKLWLAQVGNERIDEIADPEIAIQRALDYYQRHGYSEGWILQRLKSIEIRKELTNEWDRGGIKKGLEYALLTDEMYSGWAGVNTREYKKIKGLHKESLRDNMSNMELVLNMLAEATSTEIAKNEKPHGMPAHLEVARKGGEIAGDARKKLESRTGKSVITGKNANVLKSIGKK